MSKESNFVYNNWKKRAIIAAMSIFQTDICNK